MFSTPVIDGITPDTGKDFDFITSSTRLTVSGGALPLSTVRLFKDNQLIGIAQADTTGRWIFDNSANVLGDGDHFFSVQSTSAIEFPTDRLRAK